MKRVSDIITGIPDARIEGDATRLVADIAYDSRRVVQDGAFVALKGFNVDGHRFVNDAYASGARTFFVETPISLPGDATVVYLKNTRQQLPVLARNFFAPASQSMKFIGITGTNGKTTTAYLVHSILKTAGWGVGLISSIEYQTGKASQPANRTTPEALDLHRLFYEMYRNGLKSCVMEVSSHALELHRVDGIRFSAAVFTNLTQDHLDFHGTMENYFRAKALLFTRLGENDRAIINLDDPYGERLVHMTKGDVFTYSLQNPNATFVLKNFTLGHAGMFIVLRMPGGELHVQTSLTGKYNVYNILAAVTTAHALGVTPDKLAAGVERLTAVPGRLERFTAPTGARIFVDYAHTADAMARVMETLLEMHPRRLIVVFGAGGDRDAGKRPLMGKAADEYADKIILTTDNSRSEPTESIIQDILRGIENKDKTDVIIDRRQAIKCAIEMAGENDVVLIAGKGHEDYLEIQGKRIPFDDRQVVAEILAEISGG